jgi:hypothetical protein
LIPFFYVKSYRAKRCERSTLYTVYLCFIKCTPEMIFFFFSDDILHARRVRTNNVSISSFGERAYIHSQSSIPSDCISCSVSLRYICRRAVIEVLRALRDISNYLSLFLLHKCYIICIMYILHLYYFLHYILDDIFFKCTISTRLKNGIYQIVINVIILECEF